MKKVIFVIVFFILILSIGYNIKVIREKNNEKELFITNLCSSILNVTIYLDSLEAAINSNDLNQIKNHLENVSNGLIEADNQLVIGQQYIDNQLYRPGILSLSFIGNGLLHETDVNNKRMKRILDDDVISTNEKEYITRLNTDLKNILKEITLKDPYAPNTKITMKELNNIFAPFYKTWSSVDSEVYQLILQ
ncbi:MAG: hypothetical protein K0S41_3017 [Anaerocolumna sp.]|jgi:hypothetical protein|nr:hypothetical protein [Anaerocolumna sp.]